jgi:hypothetical protein
MILENAKTYFRGGHDVGVPTVGAINSSSPRILDGGVTVAKKKAAAKKAPAAKKAAKKKPAAKKAMKCCCK